ncbi:MAG: efflux RND transporter periplasmic adaptor subunit [Gemmatimonadetes bacterium]|nr:efflux RND transporter periplasmic adaptor subunit [Gemmatimonadota bacterium]
MTERPLHDSTPADAATAAAFGSRRMVSTAGGVLLPLLALGVAWWMTREPGAAPAATGAHDHAAMVARDSSGGGSLVTLSSDQARRIGVTYAPVALQALSREVRTAGQVSVDETRQSAVGSRVDGWVETLHADFTGRAVRRGEPLLSLYSPMLVALQEELLLARRLQATVAGGTPEALANARDLVEAARNRLALLEIPSQMVARIEDGGRAERTVTLYAPASGVVVEKNVTPGQRVMAGDLLFRVADLSTVWVEGEVYEQDLRAVRIGQLVTAEFDALPGERWSGRISWVAPTLSLETRTARVRVEMANRGLRLKPGMAAVLTIAGAASGAAPVMVVPRNAVLVTGERSLVFVKRADGRLEPRQVTIGATTHEMVEILRGVALGDTVVATGTFLVDAESNLGTALGGMGDMPGMEITMPPAAAPVVRGQAGDTSHRRKED